MIPNPQHWFFDIRFIGIYDKAGCREKMQWLLGRLVELLAEDGRRPTNLKVYIYSTIAKSFKLILVDPNLQPRNQLCISRSALIWSAGSCFEFFRALKVVSNLKIVQVKHLQTWFLHFFPREELEEYKRDCGKARNAYHKSEPRNSDLIFGLNLRFGFVIHIKR